MRFLSVAAVILLLLSGCKRGQDTEVLTESSERDFQAEELPLRSAVNTQAAEILSAWQPYQDLDNSFNAIYNAVNDEDMKLVIEDLLEKERLLAASEYPEEFDRPQIKSRQRVMRTYILKVRAALEYRTDFEEPTRDLILAYNALREQFNVTVNSFLDANMILDE